MCVTVCSDPLTIVDLTWYPTKASQPFRVLIDPIIPVILDVHSHLADTKSSASSR